MLLTDGVIRYDFFQTLCMFYSIFHSAMLYGLILLLFSDCWRFDPLGSDGSRYVFANALRYADINFIRYVLGGLSVDEKKKTY